MTNKDFRKAASENVVKSIKQLDYSFLQYAKNNEGFSQVGTMFSSIKQTRIINRLKELLK